MEDECTIELPSNVVLEVNVIEYGAVVTEYKVLADKGSFVQLLFNDSVSSQNIMYTL